MVQDICFHIVDMVQNAVAAGARTVTLTLRDSVAGDEIDLSVRDDGRGMDEETARNVQDPFFTTKKFKKVGLGIPLIKATAGLCHGDFAIESRLGEGTEIRTRLEKSHWDCPPLGDLAGTVLGLLVSLDEVNLVFCYRSDRGSFEISSDQVREQAAPLHLSHPDVYGFLKDYFRENLEPLLA